MIDTLKEILINNGISPSYHRLKIYEYLMNNKTHPSADKIYADILKFIPTLSKTTIYNTLKTFVEKGIVASITIENTEVRYDADVSFHGHFKCQACNGLYDIGIDHMQNERKLGTQKKIDGHNVLEKHVYFKGVCKKCLQN